MFRSETISVSIDCPLEEVYDFLLEPLNIPTWGSNLGTTIQHAGGSDWVTETPEGPLTFRVPTRNAFGVLDHAAFRPGETPSVTPMRVFANGRGCELTRTPVSLPRSSGCAPISSPSSRSWNRAKSAES